jgi:hypothetical protein
VADCCHSGAALSAKGCAREVQGLKGGKEGGAPGAQGQALRGAGTAFEGCAPSLEVAPADQAVVCHGPGCAWRHAFAPPCSPVPPTASPRAQPRSCPGRPPREQPVTARRPLSPTQARSWTTRPCRSAAPRPARRRRRRLTWAPWPVRAVSRSPLTHHASHDNHPQLRPFGRCARRLRHVPT